LDLGITGLPEAAKLLEGIRRQGIALDIVFGGIAIIIINYID
jgi:hypothetical protein